MRVDEEFVAFNPTHIASTHLRHVRLSARVRQGTIHVTALIRADDAAGPPHFRHYDNDAAPRVRGTYARLTLQEVWVTCMMMAVVKKESPLQRELMETGWKPGQGDTRGRRQTRSATTA